MVVVSLAFNALVWRIKGPHHGLDFLTGYLIEYSLSMDNIFVFVLIFAHFRVPPLAQRRVLVWGIVGALVMRGTMILVRYRAGATLSFRSVSFRSLLLITAAAHVFRKTSSARFHRGLGVADVPSDPSDYARIPRRTFSRARRWPMDAYPARSDHDRDRGHGPDLCRRFDSRDLRNYARSVHCLYVQYLRDSRLAVALFSAGRFDGSFHLPANRTCIRARLCRDQNDYRGLFAYAEGLSLGIIALILAVTIAYFDD